MNLLSGLAKRDILTNKRLAGSSFDQWGPRDWLPLASKVLSKQSSDEVEQKLTSRPTDGTIIWL